MLIEIVLFVWGLCLGSFVNALVWRMRQQLDDEGIARKMSKKRAQSLSISRGRSMCPNCGHVLSAYDLLPVLSWAFLRGKCRYCHVRISAQYPIMELLVGLLFVGSYVFWPYGFDSTWQILMFATWVLALVPLTALALYDARWTLLPDRILLPSIVAVASSICLQLLVGRPLGDTSAILGALAVSSGIFWFVYQLGEKILHKELIGYGDVKLGILLGLLIASPSKAALMLFVASVLGLLASLVMLLGSKVSAHQYWRLKIPFGPYLIIATVFVVLFGQNIVDWYIGLLTF